MPTFNVMVACDFNLLFTFVMVGWEGAAHADDTRIFLDVIHRQSINFPKPPQSIYFFFNIKYIYEGYYLCTFYLFICLFLIFY